MNDLLDPAAASEMATRIVDRDLTFLFVTIGRPDCARRLILSVRRRFPRLPIWVGDQSPPNPDQAAFYRAQGVVVRHFPFDSGVSHCRTELAREIRTPYILFGDDDFLFTEETRIEPVLRYLEARPRVGVVGGTMTDLQERSERGVRRTRRRFERLLFLSRSARGLLMLPIDMAEPRTDLFEGELFFRCDMTLNWAVLRRSIFEDERLLWDPRFKIAGEHENFFLQLQLLSEHEVAFFPGLRCDHAPVSDPGYRALRDRTEGWREFGGKWGIDWIFEVGRGLRRLDDYDRLIPATGSLPGTAAQLPSRERDFLRLWHDRSAAASVGYESRREVAVAAARAQNERLQKQVNQLTAALERHKEEVRRLKERRPERSAGEVAPSAPLRARVADLEARLERQKAARREVEQAAEEQRTTSAERIAELRQERDAARAGIERIRIQRDKAREAVERLKVKLRAATGETRPVRKEPPSGDPFRPEEALAEASAGTDTDDVAPGQGTLRTST